MAELNGQAGPGFLQRNLQQNPLAVGVIAYALGALVGLLLPETEKENALLGPKRDQLAGQAHAAVQETAQRIGAVAGTAQAAALHAVDEVKDAARDAVSEAVDSVKEEAQHQGVSVSS